MNDERSPFFIVGAGRTGTTLVRTGLSAHSRLAVPPETHYFKLIDQLGAKKNTAPADFQSFWKRLTTNRRFQDMGVDPDRVLAMTAETGGATFKGVFSAMLMTYAETLGKLRSGEKTPGHGAYLDRIFSWFPNARVITLCRDPRSVVASHLEAPWVTDELERPRRPGSMIRRLRLYHVAERATFWNVTYGTYLATSDPRVRLFRYEDLVTRPEQKLREMTDFLGEEFEPCMIDQRADVPGAAATETIKSKKWKTWIGDHERRAHSAISTDALWKWRNSLSSAEAGLVEAICGENMLRFDYAPERPQKQRFRAGLAGRCLIRAQAAEELGRRMGARLETRLRRRG